MSARRILRRKVRRDLVQRRPQIIAVAVTVFLGIGLFAANLDASRNLSASYRELYDRLAMADGWITGGPVDELAAELAAEPLVTDVATRTHADVPLRLDGRELVGRIVGGPTATRPAVNRLLIEDGRDLGPGDTNAVVLEQHAADEFDLGPGDRLDVLVTGEWRSVEIVGVAASAEYLFPARSRTEIFTVPDEFAVVFAPEPLAARTAPAGPRQAVFAVADRDADTVAKLLTTAEIAGATETYALADQPSNLALQSDVEGFEELSFLFPVLFLTVAGMATFVLLSRLVRLERNHVGMLVANGMSPGTILRHYTMHGLAASFLGAVPGLALGVILGRWISGLYTGFLDIPITVTRVSGATIAWSLGFALTVGLVAGGLPARAAARIEPAEAMRPQSPAGVGHPTLVERIAPFPVPTGVRLVLRNLVRNPRRAGTTALGVVLALVLLITSLALNDTVAGVIGRQYDEIDKRDISVTLDEPVTTSHLAEFSDLPDVATAERSIELPVVVAAAGQRSEQLLQVLVADTVAHGFADPLPATGIVLGASARDSLDVGTGDEVTVHVPSVGLSAPIIVAGFVDEPIPSISYASLTAWADVGGPPSNEIVLTLVDDDLHRAVRDRLAARDDVVAVTDHRAAVDAIRQLMGITVVFVGLMVAFGVVMAVALLFNATTVSLAERTGEIATLLANGVSRRWIRGTVTGETLCVVGLGVLPGLGLGWLVAGAFLGQFSNESFTFDLVLSARSLVLAVVLVVVGSLVAQVPGLRGLDRLDLPAVVRERSV